MKFDDGFHYEKNANGGSDLMFDDRITIVPKNDPSWATCIPGRSPAFKVHSNIGQAKNAISYRIGNNGAESCAIYERMGDEWVCRLKFGRPFTSHKTRAECKALIKGLKPTMSVQPLKKPKKAAPKVVAGGGEIPAASTVIHVCD